MGPMLEEGGAAELCDWSFRVKENRGARPRCPFQVKQSRHFLRYLFTVGLIVAQRRRTCVKIRYFSDLTDIHGKILVIENVVPSTYFYLVHQGELSYLIIK